MDQTLFWIYCLLILLVSMCGGVVPMVIRLTHRRLQIATSLIAGFLLGVGLLTLLPHALLAIPVATAMGWVVVGLLVMFFLERFFTYHHHIAPGDEGMPPVTADPEPVGEKDCDAAPGHPIDHAHGHSHAHSHEHPVKLSWVGVSLGLVIHSLIGGIALAAAMQAEDLVHDHGHAWALPGLAVFLGIFLHKPFDAMTLLTLLRTTGWPRAVQHLVNFGFATCTPIGGILFYIGLAGVDMEHSIIVGCALAFAAGVFLCVALADLLPEIHFHKHDRGILSLAVLAGLALAWAIAIAEAQTHHHDHHDHHDHSHHDHSHDHSHDHDHSHSHDHDHRHDHDH